MNDFNVPVILASTSPRRIELLKAAGLEVEVRAPDADETPKKGELAKAMVARLAREKAQSLMKDLLWEHGAAIVIAADTTVVAPNGKTILGKPVDEADARRMLKMLAGKTHTVHTGFCILSIAREMKPERVVRVVTTKVTMRKLTAADIEAYVKTREPMDKAGSYAAQGLGMALIERISGSYTNVVGLPLSQLLLDLERKFGFSLFQE